MRGQGAPHLGAKGRGDLHVTVRVIVPTKLSAEQRKLLEQLGKTLPKLEIKDKEKDKDAKAMDRDHNGVITSEEMTAFDMAENGRKPAKKRERARTNRRTGQGRRPSPGQTT